MSEEQNKQNNEGNQAVTMDKYNGDGGMTADQFKQLALLMTVEAEKGLGIDKFSALERCKFYFNCGWDKALVVARAKEKGGWIRAKDAPEGAEIDDEKG